MEVLVKTKSLAHVTQEDLASNFFFFFFFKVSCKKNPTSMERQAEVQWKLGLFLSAGS